MIKVERFQVNPLKWTTHFNLSFTQVCDFEVTDAGKAVHDFSRLDGVSNSAMKKLPWDPGGSENRVPWEGLYGVHGIVVEPLG